VYWKDWEIYTNKKRREERLLIKCIKMLSLRKLSSCFNGWWLNIKESIQLRKRLHRVSFLVLCKPQILNSKKTQKFKSPKKWTMET
jgi:hypothetical protein